MTQGFNSTEAKGWTHGVDRPYTFFSHEVLEAISTKIRSSKSLDQDVLLPKVILGPIKYQDNLEHHENNETETFLDSTQQIPRPLVMESNPGVFSGYYMVPPLLFNLKLKDSSNFTQVHQDPAIPKFVLQNHFEVGEFAYCFGGLYTDELVSLSRLGIPTNTDLSRILVYLPCDFPPFIDRRLLSNPYLVQNTHMVKFSKIRNTFSFLKDFSTENVPSHYSGMTAVTISDHHVFFYGGFTLNTDKVTFDRSSERWLVYKSIDFNQNGYILDVLTMSFTLIKLDLKLEHNQSINMARIGLLIFACPWNPDVSNELPDRMPLPIFSDSSTPAPHGAKSTQQLNKSSPVSYSHDEERTASYSKSSSTENQGPTLSQAPVATYVTQKSIHLNKSGSLNTSLDNDKSISTKQKPSLDAEVTDSADLMKLLDRSPTSDKLSKRMHKASSSNSITSSDGKNDLERSGSTLTNDSTNSSLNDSTISKYLSGFRLHLASTVTNELGGAQSKVLSMFSKLTRIFHRHHASNTKSPLAKEVLLRSESLRRRQLDSKSKPVAHERHKRYPSNSHNSLQRQKSRTSTVSTASTGLQESPQLPQAIHAAPSTPSTINIPSEEPLEDHTPAPAPTITPSNDTSEESGMMRAPTNESTKAKPSIESVIGKPKISTPKPRTNPAPFLEESALLNTQIFTLTMYVFGGFVPQVDEFGYTYYKASNEMLRIDLPCEDNQRVKFDSEALVCRVEQSPGLLWPLPRGYFGGTLINKNITGSRCSNKGTAKTTLGPVPTSHTPSGGPSEDESNHSLTLKDKRIFIHGGVDENYNLFSDIFIYDIESGSWELMKTYIFDTYQQDKLPSDDEPPTNFKRGDEKASPPIVEAELRACHHFAMYHTLKQQDLVIFFGGFRNETLRYYDQLPYESPKFDVLRLSRFPIIVNNSNLLQVPVLDLRTQTWRYMKYYFEVKETITNQFADRVTGLPYFYGCHINNFGGHISIYKKQITLYHGLFHLSPVHQADIAKLDSRYPSTQSLWGAVSRFNFPSM